MSEFFFIENFNLNIVSLTLFNSICLQGLARSQQRRKSQEDCPKFLVFPKKIFYRNFYQAFLENLNVTDRNRKVMWLQIFMKCLWLFFLLQNWFWKVFETRSKEIFLRSFEYCSTAPWKSSMWVNHFLNQWAPAHTKN